MIVRCGRCQAAFDVAGPGRYACPACGTQNQVGDQPAPAPGPPPAPAEPPPPSPRVTCGVCGYSFIVGDVDVAPCPNCGTAVTVRVSDDEDE